MLKKKVTSPPMFGKKRAFQLSLIVSFIFNAVLILGVLYGQMREHKLTFDIGWLSYLKYFLWNFICNIIFFYLLFLFNFKLIRSHIKANKIPLSATIGTLMICFFFSPLLSQIQWSAIGGEKGMVTEGFAISNFIKDMILGAIVILITHNLYSNYKREQTIITNQKLTEDNIRIRFEALKNQLDPHFLFNSLNTLNGLIGIEDEKAHEYVDNLSSVFRYTLENKHIRTLNEEIEFVESYVALLKIRYGDNFVVKYDLAEQYRNYLVMPVSIQLLVENAVKHNVISNKSRLFIHIETTDNESIIVSNHINRKTEKSLNCDVGLANLTDRYAILFKKNITISNLEGVFAVEIPLIKEMDKI
ncbi:MAG: histidine kinase [Bacteroidales bacterium]|jgi:LytS/YehU family sensor histidine kinase|nr:histidine kinase [Bacteroidales bacterium]